MKRIHYCPCCGREIHPTFRDGKEIDLLYNGSVYRCLGCDKKFKTSGHPADIIQILSEHEYKYLVDLDYRKQIDTQDRVNKVTMEQAYSNLHDFTKDIAKEMNNEGQ